MANQTLLICPICGSMDVAVEQVTIGDQTEDWYVCNDCEYEWPVIASKANSVNTIEEAP